MMPILSRGLDINYEWKANEWATPEPVGEGFLELMLVHKLEMIGKMRVWSRDTLRQRTHRPRSDRRPHILLIPPTRTTPQTRRLMRSQAMQANISTVAL